MMDIELLRSFVSVVDAGGFTRAGERVHRTQSTVSQQIKRLEDMLGRPLLERNGKQATLTEEGERLISYARRILALEQEARDVVARPVVDGVVRLGIPEDFAAYRLPELLYDFKRARPTLRLDVRCGLERNAASRARCRRTRSRFGEARGRTTGRHRDMAGAAAMGDQPRTSGRSGSGSGAARGRRAGMSLSQPVDPCARRGRSRLARRLYESQSARHPGGGFGRPRGEHSVRHGNSTGTPHYRHPWFPADYKNRAGTRCEPTIPARRSGGWPICWWISAPASRRAPRR